MLSTYRSRRGVSRRGCSPASRCWPWRWRSIGVYGLVAYTVSQRAREIGIRLALGATPQNIRALLLGQGTLLAGGGIAAGLVLAALAAPAMAALLYGVAPMDWPVFGSVALVLFAVALLATYLPAHRAAKSDPIRALRDG